MLLRLLLIFIITPILIIITAILEMAILIKLGKPAIDIIVRTGIAGALLLAMSTSQGLRVYRNIRGSLYSGELPHNHLIEELLMPIGGALLITPGLLTDVVGFMLVLPWTRKLVRENLKRYFKWKIVRIQTKYDYRRGPMKLSKKDLEDELIESYVTVDFDWDEIEESAPEYGGVYVMNDDAGQVVYVMKTGVLGSFKKQLLDHWEYRMWEQIFDVYCLKVDDKNKDKLYRKLVSKYHPELNRSVGYEFWK